MNDSASIHVTVDRDFEHIVVICKAVQKRLRVKMVEEFFMKIKIEHYREVRTFQEFGENYLIGNF